MAKIINITEQDHARITEAIKAAESRTSGEIFAVVARQSDDYFYVAGFMAGLWSLAVGVVLAMVAYLMQFQVPLPVFVAAQLASLVTFIVMFRTFPDLRMMFVPHKIAYRRASNNAVRQFLAHGVHATAGRTGVLLYMSLAERYAEVVADSEINACVEQDAWDAMVSIMTQSAAKGDIAAGFIAAIEQSGALLARHFPPIPGDENELDDRLMEI